MLFVATIFNHIYMLIKETCVVGVLKVLVSFIDDVQGAFGLDFVSSF